MNYKIITYILSLIFIAAACTSDFEETNENPNDPETAPYTNVFGYCIEELASLSGSTEMIYTGSYVGYTAKGTYNDPLNYLSTPGTGTWDGIYSDILTNANYVIEGAEEEGNYNLKAAAMVIRAYAFQMAVDVYGKVPYFEAGQAEDGIVHPAYDEEDEIYLSLLDSLEVANSLFDAEDGGDIGDGDLVYSGDVDMWQKFCNSLRLRMAIRISNVDESSATTVISSVLGNSDTYPIFDSNDDNAYITYTGGDWVEPWTSQHNSIGDEFIAKPIIDTLVKLGDPRIAYYAEPLDDGSYNGLPVGDDADDADDYSRIGSLFVENETGDLYFMKYAEIELIKAEAYARGLASGDAQTAYEDAITASCEEYDIDASTIADYLADSNVAYNGSLSQIYTQKWVALFRQCWEGWAEMRRTDVPALDPATNSSYSGHNRPPFRFPYPDSEEKLNSDNIPSDVVEDDNFWGYQIWWDTRTNVQ
jgi:hypothetical protein